MKVLKSLSDLKTVQPGCVLTIGNFDGVHLGHQEILKKARLIAEEKSLELIVMTFEPHQVAILHPEKAPAVLTPLDYKLHLLSDFADDCIVVLKDNKELLSLSCVDFVDKFLNQSIKPAVIVEGDDFHFGAGRQGDVITLQQLGKNKGFDVIIVPTRQIELSTSQQIRASSTIVRYMLESGHVVEAAKVLSRSYRLIGRIISGRGKGAELGFPTLNMQKPGQILPAEGVYAGRVVLAQTPQQLFAQKADLPAVFSIGQARTFGYEHPLLIEAHLLVKPPPNLADKWMAMDFLQRLRSQHKFKSPDELAEQIARDCAHAREVLGITDN